ncbi:MAG: hypothetical protein KF869_05870 [Phycisphaeraceae bacterium]|nr:hypothetical protein [Phycisphaeraceae bacterium]
MAASAALWNRHLQHRRDEQTVFAIRCAGAAHAIINDRLGVPQFMLALNLSFKNSTVRQCVATEVSVSKDSGLLFSPVSMHVFIGTKTAEGRLSEVVIIQTGRMRDIWIGQFVNSGGRDVLAASEIDFDAFEWFEFKLE